MARRYFIETFGCQMNYHDSERMAGLLEANGYLPVATDAEADVVVLNTCSVRERAEEKLYTRLGELRMLSESRHDPPIVAVTGCVAQQEGSALLRRDSSIDVILGTQRLKELPHLIDAAAERRGAAVDVRPHDDLSFPFGIAKHSDPVRAWVTIIEGCNEFCSFCVVPYTRGHERMRPVRDILHDVRLAVDGGRPEVQLLGQIVNHYQAPDDASCDFAELLARVAQVPGVRRVRFASPHPRHVSDRLIAAIRDIPAVCRHLHMPVQSGSTRMLNAMRRRYSRESYLELVSRLKQEIPELALSTDVIVGFPGETAEDFELTLSLVAEARFLSMFSFKYSPRPNTLAQKRMPDDVPEAEKSRRIVELQALQRAIQMEEFSSMVGGDAEVLIDGPSRRRPWEMSGRTEGNTVVNLEGGPELVGTVQPVRITGHGPNSLRGELVGAANPAGEPAAC